MSLLSSGYSRPGPFDRGAANQGFDVRNVLDWIHVTEYTYSSKAKITASILEGGGGDGGGEGRWWSG